MQIAGLAKKVSVYIGESDKWQHKPLHSAILEMLRQEDCAGGTVTRALAGFGAHSRIHTAKLVDLSADLPLVIEWVDSPARVQRVMPRLQAMVGEGLITVEDVEVIAYQHRNLRDLSDTLPVQDIMSREVHAIPINTPLEKAAELLLDKIYRALPVLDQEQKLVGILTEGDLLDATDILATSAQAQLTPAEMTTQLKHLRQLNKSVAQVMTPNPITISGSATVPQAVTLMLAHNIKRLPVVDADNNLTGIISRVDILRAFSQPPVGEAPRQDPPSGQQHWVETVMMTHVPTVHVDASLAEIVGLLVSSTQRRVVVVDEAQHVMGIITDGDLVKRATPAERDGILTSLSRRLPAAQSHTFHLSQRTAAEVMTTPVVMTTTQTTLTSALQLLLSHHIKRLPVVNHKAQLVGLIGRGGILQAIGSNYVNS